LIKKSQEEEHTKGFEIAEALRMFDVYVDPSINLLDAKLVSTLYRILHLHYFLHETILIYHIFKFSTDIDDVFQKFLPFFVRDEQLQAKFRDYRLEGLHI